jgi:hypothetical protein
LQKSLYPKSRNLSNYVAQKILFSIICLNGFCVLQKGSRKGHANHLINTFEYSIIVNGQVIDYGVRTVDENGLGLIWDGTGASVNGSYPVQFRFRNNCGELGEADLPVYVEIPA